MKRLAVVTAAVASASFFLAATPPARADGGRDFLTEARDLLVVGACADGAPAAKIKPEIVAKHCKEVKKAQEEYLKNWVTPARAFFAEHAIAAKVVVYPFAGGDLSTALTVFPDADEITTLSLEPAGDPLSLGRLSEGELTKALEVVASELGKLYRSSFSVTMNMIDAMRGGQLPTQLVFSLSALWLHGYEPTSLRYFKLTPEGEIHYLTDDEVKEAEAIKDHGKRNEAFANIELGFRKKGSTHDQVYRHILANLEDKHLKKDPAALLYLEKKGHVTGMTKAASYLLTFDEFSTMRKYVIEHVDWMISDSTGLAPSWGTPAGYEYETYGDFEKSNMDAGKPVAGQWKKLFDAQPKRALGFRFGYPDGRNRGHLVIMRRPAAAK
jgi:hypothetical protein